MELHKGKNLCYDYTGESGKGNRATDARGTAEVASDPGGFFMPPAVRALLLQERGERQSRPATDAWYPVLLPLSLDAKYMNRMRTAQIPAAEGMSLPDQGLRFFHAHFYREGGKSCERDSRDQRKHDRVGTVDQLLRAAG